MELTNRQSVLDSRTNGRTEAVQAISSRNESANGARRRVASEVVNTSTANIDLANEDRRSINQSPLLMLFCYPEEMSGHAAARDESDRDDEQDVSEEGSIDGCKSRTDSRSVLRKSTKIYARKTRCADHESKDVEELVNINRQDQSNAGGRRMHTSVPQYIDPPRHSNTWNAEDAAARRHGVQHSTGLGSTRLIRERGDRLQSLLENLASQPRKF